MTLKEKKCVPCEGGVAALTDDQITSKLESLTEWEQCGKKIKKLFKFKDFKKALTFVNQVGDIAEAERHHPDIFLAYGKAEIEIWTHAINGLSENDFILAAKIDDLVAT